MSINRRSFTKGKTNPVQRLVLPLQIQTEILIELLDQHVTQNILSNGTE
jgi:hypothetical protein